MPGKDQKPIDKDTTTMMGTGIEKGIGTDKDKVVDTTTMMDKGIKDKGFKEKEKEQIHKHDESCNTKMMNEGSCCTKTMHMGTGDTKMQQEAMSKELHGEMCGERTQQTIMHEKKTVNK